MNRRIRANAVLVSAFLIFLVGCAGQGGTTSSDTANTQAAGNTESSKTPDTETDAKADDTGDTIVLTIGDRKLTVALVDNSSVTALQALLAQGPLTIHMSDYANMEKVGPIGTSLPRNDEQITTDFGDIILYQGNSLVIYYDRNSWNFTRIGRIDGVTQAELKNMLGSGNVTVTLSLD